MPVEVPAEKDRKEYRLKPTAAMLTYVGFESGLLEIDRLHPQLFGIALASSSGSCSLASVLTFGVACPRIEKARV